MYILQYALHLDYLPKRFLHLFAANPILLLTYTYAIPEKCALSQGMPY